VRHKTKTFSCKPLAALMASAAILLAGCSGTAPLATSAPPDALISGRPPAVSGQGDEVALYALGLIGTDYRFGGKNPEAGLDCSGMVTYIYREATGLKVNGSAADIARLGKEIDKRDLRPGDLVFFNTLHRPFSHVGVYIGDGRFVHAPSTNGKVRIGRLDNRYFASRFEMARSFFD
jgi:cell wall-associated NlpC family hydrolase